MTTEALATRDSQATDTTALSPLVSSPLPVFTGAQMAQALMAYQDLQQALDRSMPDQIMQLDGKAFRKKGYWRAIAVAFGLTVEPVEERREVAGLFADGRENFGYVVSYRATAPNGRTVTSDGTCFAVEKARRFKCPHLKPGSDRYTIHFPHHTCPDFDAEYQWRILPSDATEHNVRGHAHTRAFNRAVSNLVGFGEVTAEEVVRDDEAPATAEAPRNASVQQPQRTQREPSAAAPAASAKGPFDPEKTYTLKRVWQPNTGKAYRFLELVADGQSFTVHTWDEGVMATAGNVTGQAVRVSGQIKDFNAAPFQVKSIKVVSGGREPGAEG